jgi:hypothetical protein
MRSRMMMTSTKNFIKVSTEAARVRLRQLAYLLS